MDDATQENAQSAVLLSWRMPIWKRVPVTLVYFSTWVLFVWAFTMAIPFGCGHTFRGSMCVLPLALLFMVALALSSRVVVALEMRSEGIAAEVWAGFRVARADWADVRTLVRRPAWLVSLRTKGYGCFLLGLPEPVLARLVSILRETSNARIIGFD